MSKFGFDLNDYESNGGGSRTYDPLPKGDYKLKCTEAEEKETRSGGVMIAATFEVVGGEHDGRKVWNNYNIHNSSEKAQKIGREQVASWAKACGKPNATSFDELLERPFTAVLDIEKGKDGYSDKNRIVGYVLGSAPAPKVAPKPAQQSLADMEDDIPEAKPAKGDKKKNPWD